MPREQINTPARRTITLMRDENGELDGGWAQGWYDPMQSVPEGTAVEPTAVLAVAWRGGHVGTDDPDGACMYLVMQIGADEVLRKADQIRANRLIEFDPGELPKGVPAARLDQSGEVVIFETVALSRPEAQKLVRATKRARDAVFGADE